MAPQKLDMSPRLHYPTMFQDVDHVCSLDCAETVCDRDGRAAFRYRV